MTARPLPEHAPQENLHQGHRARLRRSFLEQGLDSLPDVNALELLLFYAIPRQDTNQIAHRLINAFGSLADVFDAPVEELMRRGGLTENAAALIKLTIAVSRRYQIRRASTEQIMNTTAKCGAYLVPHFIGARDEMVYAMALDGKCKLLGCTKLFSGTVNSSSLYVRNVVEYAMRMKATSIILAHNHPSGIATPSREDISVTGMVRDALNLVDVILADHIIVADDDFVSLAESGMLRRP